MPSAIQAVLDIPELFQLILLQCDIRTLLTSARCVSHLWHSVIDSTPAIQEALFFRPNTRDNEPEPILNPLLVETFSLFFDGGIHTRKSFDKLPFANGGKNGCRDAFMRKDASWRRMLVRQPPVRTMGVWHWETSRGHVIDTGSFWQLIVSELCCPSPFNLCESCHAILNAGPDRRDLDLTMGILYDDDASTGISRISHFTFFWNPKSRASFAFADGPEDQNIRIRDEKTGGEDWDNPKLLSELATGVDLIKGIKYPGSCRRGGGVPRSKEEIDCENRFKYPCA
ncbi:hypothetical protein F5B21DRAFT_44683 [Xylaria acuta]|nr:hypothetical protein F5B21DRAFT_44683 [Xylaria acuta]